MKRLVLGLSLIATAAVAAEFPPHAHTTWGGWIECDRGYLMRDHACISEADAAREPKTVISRLPSAGDGVRGAPSSQPPAAAPQQSAQQTSNDWFVFIPAPVPARHSVLFGR